MKLNNGNREATTEHKIVFKRHHIAVEFLNEYAVLLVSQSQVTKVYERTNKVHAL
jgi:hypothetical protein